MFVMRRRRAKCVLFLTGVCAVVLGVCGQEKEVKAEVSVTDAAQFYEAAENGETVLLEDDIVLTEPVWFEGDAGLYGNGHELRFESLAAEDSGLAFSGGTSDAPCVIDDVAIVADDGEYCGSGVYADEDSVLELSDVTVSGFSQGISAYGSMVMTDCRIDDNGNCGIIAHTDGSVEMLDGEIRDNKTDGVYIDGGTFHQEGGEISGNGRYGIYQNGRYEMAEDASVHVEDGGNDIFLTENRVVHLTDELTSQELLGCILTAPDDRALRRRVVEATDNVPDSHIASLNGRFALRFEEVSVETDGGEKFMPDAAVRAGNGVNAPANTMILSGMLTGKFESGLTQTQMDGVPGFSIADMPEEENFYWKEAHTFEGLNKKPVPQKKLLDENGDDRIYAIDGSMVFQGWTSRIGLDGEPLVNKVEVPAERLEKDVVFTADWDFRVDLLCCGNGQTNEKDAPDYEIFDLTAESEMPYNDGPHRDVQYREADQGATRGYFQKAYQWTAADQKRYDKNRESYVDYLEQYAFEGWSKREDCIYKDEDRIAPGDLLSGGDTETADRIGWFLGELAQIERAHSRTENEGMVEIRYYAVWDRFPEIDAPDRYFLLSDATGGRITEEELLRRAEAVDTEDGMLENGTELRLVDFVPEDLLELGDAGSVTVRYAATDLAGNSSYYDATVHMMNDEGSTSHIEKETGTSRRSPIYTRFVSKKFYEMGLKSDDEAASLKAYDSGALEPYSLWYQKEEYRKILKEAFSRLESGAFVESFSYTRDAIRSAQAFLQSEDVPMTGDDFRENFAEKFVRPAKK